MVIFLNLDGTAVKVSPQHIYQGSNNVTTITAIAPYDNSTALSIAFRMPDETDTQYRPMLYTTSDSGVGAWQYTMPNSVTARQGELYIAINAKSLNGNTTSYLVKTVVEPSIMPGLPPTPDQDVYDLILLYLQQNSADIVKLDKRISTLEDVTVRKVLVDFTVNSQTGEGIKYYSDGSTATVRYPTGGGGLEIVTDVIRVLNFDPNAFYVADDDTCELAYSAMATGYNNANYVSVLDVADTKTYEAGVEHSPSVHSGYSQLADSFFKGSDGSLLLYGLAKPFAGRVVLLGGTVYGGELVDGGYYDRPNNQIVLTFYNGKAQNIPLVGVVNDGNYVHTDNNFTAAYKNLIDTINARDSLVNVTFDTNTFVQTFEQRHGADINIQLPKPSEAQRYVTEFGISDWQGATAPYSITITASTHGKGANPTWQFGDNQIFDATNSNGNLTIYTNTKKSLKIIII